MITKKTPTKKTTARRKPLSARPLRDRENRKFWLRCLELGAITLLAALLVLRAPQNFATFCTLLLGGRAAFSLPSAARSAP